MRNKAVLKTPEQARAELLRRGISISAWANQNGLSRSLVHAVLKGGRPCRFGKSHKAAVLLGIKDGELAA